MECTLTMMEASTRESGRISRSTAKELTSLLSELQLQASSMKDSLRGMENAFGQTQLSIKVTLKKAKCTEKENGAKAWLNLPILTKDNLKII